VKFLRDWLRVERPAGVATHASQTIEIDGAYADAFRRCVRGIEEVLGGAVREADEQRGTIEATFGLIDSERLTCTLAAMDDRRTRIIIESRRGISAAPAKPSTYVRALAEYLRKPE
jgi:hypothetical protein